MNTCGKPTGITSGNVIGRKEINQYSFIRRWNHLIFVMCFNDNISCDKNNKKKNQTTT